LERYGAMILGVLNGFDRLVLRGILRPLSVLAGMRYFLWKKGVFLTEFGPYAERATEELKEVSLQAARDAGRPIRYLTSPKTDKQDLAQRIAREDGVTEGLIAILTCVEVCRSYTVRRNREAKKLELVVAPRKCLHVYHYAIDPVFGFMNARIQTWFPFNIQVCVNGREWLARRLDREGVRYDRRENCFVWIEDVARAQELMGQLLRTAWPAELDRIARQLNPRHTELLHPFVAHYYWMTHESEWASDVLFRSPAALAGIYPQLARHGVTTLGSPDVMRFLGRKLTGNFRGEVVSDYKKRPEGIRVKHRVNRNSLKVYDKAGSILRVETTINNPRDFKVHRPKEGGDRKARKWRKMRKGIADLHRVAQVSQASNERYLDTLASLDTSAPVGEVVRKICRPVRWHGTRVRALRPWSDEDRHLFEAVMRGEFLLNGFRNRDLQALLFPRAPASPEERARRRAAVTRRLRMLRAHGLIKKVTSTHRYLLTKKGRQILTAVLATQALTLQEIKKAAA
jgi:hypothetical protein